MIDYNNIDSVIGGFLRVLKVQTGSAGRIPTPLILIGAPLRAGLSPTKIASRIIARKAEAGLPIGALPSGAVSPDELMERIRAEEIVKAIQQEMVVSVAIPAGITITGAGANAGGAVTVFGSTITIAKGFGIAQ